jgi:C4-dicarboxylate transporter
MRNAMLATLALLAAAAATVAGSGPAAAIDYPYCIPSASGRRVYCNVNPRAAFGQQRRALPNRDY